MGDPALTLFVVSLDRPKKLFPINAIVHAYVRIPPQSTSQMGLPYGPREGLRDVALRAHSQ